MDTPLTTTNNYNYYYCNGSCQRRSLPKVQRTQMWGQKIKREHLQIAKTQMTCADPGIFFRGSSPDGQKTVWTTFVLFYSLQRGSYGFITEKLYFSKDPEGVQQFPWGVQMLISLIFFITCDFPRGVRIHYPPSGSTQRGV